MLDTISINIFIFNRKIREKTQLPLPILFFPLLPFSLGTHLLLAARPCTRSSLPARARLSAARPCALGRLGAGRAHPSGAGPAVPLEPGRAHAHGPGERRPLGRAAPAPAKMEMEEPTPRFFSDIFPENHADLSWVLDG